MYNEREIVAIIAACNTTDDVLECCKIFRYLIKQNEPYDIEFLQNISLIKVREMP
jgi:hypothetical protein